MATGPVLKGVFTFSPKNVKVNNLSKGECEMLMVLLRGISGSGKSTYASLLGNAGAVICSADDYMVSVETGQYRFDSARLNECHSRCLLKFLDALMAGEEVVVVDNTNVTVEECAPYILAAEQCGYNIKVIEFFCNPRDALKRNTHSVPEHSLMRQVHRWQLLDPSIPTSIFYT
jgi:predicted kinase